MTNPAINNDLQALPRDENYNAIQGVFRSMSSGHGSVTTSGTPVQLTSTPTQAKYIDVYNSNTTSGDAIIVGGSNVKYSTGNGIPIEATFTYRLQITDLSQVWIDSQNNGDTFSYNYFW